MPFSAAQKSNLDETQWNWMLKRQKVMCCVTSEAAGERSMILKAKGNGNKKVLFTYTLRRYFSESKRQKIFFTQKEEISSFKSKKHYQKLHNLTKLHHDPTY
jgi:hypothetical protein